MILDYENMYADGQALTASAASTHIIDHGAAGDLGAGRAMVVVINVDVAADTANADETYQFVLQQDDNSGFASPSEVIAKSIPGGALAAGSQHVIPVPPGALSERYSRLFSTLGGTTPSITYTAHLLPMSHIQHWSAYADAV